MSKALLVLALLVGAGCGGHSLSDADLLKYADSSYDKKALQGQRLVVGVHNGVRVVADFPCEDLCPQYTTRIIHYDVKPGPACAAIGGVVRDSLVPLRATSSQRPPYCMPEVLAERQQVYPL